MSAPGTCQRHSWCKLWQVTRQIQPRRVSPLSRRAHFTRDSRSATNVRSISAQGSQRSCSGRSGPYFVSPPPLQKRLRAEFICEGSIPLRFTALPFAPLGRFVGPSPDLACAPLAFCSTLVVLLALSTPGLRSPQTEGTSLRGSADSAGSAPLRPLRPLRPSAPSPQSAPTSAPTLRGPTVPPPCYKTRRGPRQIR